MMPWTTRTCIVTIVLTFACLPAWSTDLWEVYQVAKEKDPAIKAAERRLEAEQLRPAQAAALLRRPTITGAASRTRRDEHITSSGEFISSGDDTYKIDAFSLTLTQPLYDRSKRIAIDQATLQAESAALLFAEEEQNLILRVAERYFAVLAALDNLELAKSEKVAINRQLELAQERLDVGLGTRTDLFDAQARYQLAEAGEIVAKNLIDDARQALGELILLAPEHYDPLRDDAPLYPPTPNNIMDWIHRAGKDNLTLRQRQIAVDVAQEEIRKQRSGRWPLVDLDVSHTRSDSDGGIRSDGSDRHATDVLLQLSVPFYRGGLTNLQSEEAASLHQVTLEELEGQRRATERQTRDAYLDATSSINQVRALEQAVLASESSVQAKEEGFAAGLDTNLDVLDAQRDLFEAKRDYLRARYDYILNVLRLEQVVGMLDEDDVRRVNGWLE